jgi:hypothetical protein
MCYSILPKVKSDTSFIDKNKSQVIPGIPLVIPKSEVQCFTLCKGCEIWIGIAYRDKVYKLHTAFKVGHFHDSFQLAKLLAQDCQVILTTGQIHHCVWTELSSLGQWVKLITGAMLS